jgi:hypothetical protein
MRERDTEANWLGLALCFAERHHSGLTQATTSNEHAVVLGTRLKTSSEEHAAAADNDTSAASEPVSDPRSEWNSNERADVLNGTRWM